MAVAAHFGNAAIYAGNWSAVRDFWWQVSWRAPQIMPETVLAARYSAGSINEDYFVWGPANLVYYPEPAQRNGPIRTPLAAIVLTPQNVQAIQMGIAQPERERRGIVLKVVPITPAGEVDPTDFRAALGPRTRLAAFTAVSNALGTETPVAELVALARAAGAASRAASGWCGRAPPRARTAWASAMSALTWTNSGTRMCSMLTSDPVSRLSTQMTR